MDLRKAYEIVIEDLLQNNNGGVSQEDLKNVDVERFTKQLINNDVFLINFTNAGESVIAEFIDDYGDEYGIW